MTTPSLEKPAPESKYWMPLSVLQESSGEWDPTPESRAAAQSALDEIQARHAATAKRCPLCGQLTARMDDFGLCSKVSPPHAKWRAQVLARENAGVPRKRPRRFPEFTT